ncbi:MAG TPA: NAD(P)-binding domain-containing protein [Acetobacteraceae bacterium]|nr:NAD(P)-binding domain-containing protein [Acetobacteraceae bacterium]
MAARFVDQTRQLGHRKYSRPLPRPDGWCQFACTARDSPRRQRRSITMQLGIIGAGNVGNALATGWIRAGHSITFGIRDPSAAVNRTAARSPEPTDYAM